MFQLRSGNFCGDLCSTWNVWVVIHLPQNIFENRPLDNSWKKINLFLYSVLYINQKCISLSYKQTNKYSYEKDSIPFIIIDIISGWIIHHFLRIEKYVRHYTPDVSSWELRCGFPIRFLGTIILGGGTFDQTTFCWLIFYRFSIFLGNPSSLCGGGLPKKNGKTIKN